jgi:hypothetical protein
MSISLFSVNSSSSIKTFLTYEKIKFQIKNECLGLSTWRLDLTFRASLCLLNFLGRASPSRSRSLIPKRNPFIWSSKKVPLPLAVSKLAEEVTPDVPEKVIQNKK